MLKLLGKVIVVDVSSWTIPNNLRVSQYAFG
jgi:hypothetical protein